MKTLKLTTAIIVIAFFTCGNILGQMIQDETVATFDKVDFGPGIGIVSGTYTYHFVFHLSKEGFIESIHWNASDFNLYNDNGDKVKVIDSGHDSKGDGWDMWNYINTWNVNNGFTITYNVTDGWLDGIMPTEKPDEGTFIAMSFKILVKGKMIKFGSLALLHLNAKGEPIVDVIKSFAE